MATGTPVLSFDIAGIPREYLKYLFIVKEETTEALSKAITDILNLNKEYLKGRGIEAREFVMKEKNTKKQCLRIWNFVMN